MQRLFELLRKHRLFLFSISDQAISSLANFVLTITLARNFGATEFASYGVGSAIALIAQSILRNCYLVTTMLSSSRVLQKLGAARIGEHSVALLVVMSLVCLILIPLQAARIVNANIIASILVFLPFSLQSDFARVVLLKRGMLIVELILSLLYLSYSLIMFFGVSRLNLSFQISLIFLVVVTLVNYATMCLMVGRPNFRWGFKLLASDFRNHLHWALISAGGHSAVNQVPLIILGYSSPLLYSASYVATRAIFQPLQVLFRSMDLLQKHRFSEAVHSDVAARANFWLAVREIVLVASCFLIPLNLAPNELLAVLYGGRYQSSHQIIALWSLINVLFLFNSPLDSIAFSRGYVRPIMSWRFAAGLFTALISAVLCPFFHDLGALTSSFLGSLISVTGGIWATRSVLLKRPSPVPGGLKIGWKERSAKR